MHLLKKFSENKNQSHILMVIFSFNIHKYIGIHIFISEAKIWSNLFTVFCWQRGFACVTEAVLKKREKVGEARGVKRKLEREIEEEMGDDYMLDLKKNYDLQEEYKYDIIPELWEGHNIADYIDPEIFQVRISM